MENVLGSIRKNLVINIKGKDLVDEKRKDYRNVVIMQVIIIFSGLLLEDLFRISGVPENLAYTIRDCIFLAVGALYVYTMWDLLRDFSQNKFLIYFLFFWINGSFLFAILTVNPIYKFIPPEYERVSLFYIHTVLFIVEATVIYHSILDLFTGTKMSQEKLWGSACIFLMIGICFGSLYDLICIIQPGSLGVNIPLGMESYTECVYYSMSIIGNNPGYPEASTLIRNLGIIESVWSNLFIVLLVGRLLGTPDDPKATT